MGRRQELGAGAGVQLAWGVALLVALLMSWGSAQLLVPIPRRAPIALSLRGQKTPASAGLGAVFSLRAEEMSFPKYRLPTGILAYAN